MDDLCPHRDYPMSTPSGQEPVVDTFRPFLNVRTAVLNDTLEDAFRSRHPGFRPANDDHKATAAAA
jgi:hypothetical protein